MSKLFIQLLIAVFAVMFSMLTVIGMTVINMSRQTGAATKAPGFLEKFQERGEKASALLTILQDAHENHLLQKDYYEPDLTEEQRNVAKRAAELL